VNLRAAAAVGLKCALRHGTRAPELFMENDVGQTLKNATSGQRLIISYGSQPTKEDNAEQLFHNSS
jgi:hypothetical protein